MSVNGTIGPLRMSGLIIGPILGSGIIILPPLAQRLAGDWAVPAWLVTVTISMLFAWIFGRLSLLFPGEAGISSAVEAAFGPALRRLTSFYLIGAVLFGPVAVMLTIVHYLPFAHGWPQALPGIVLTLLASALLLQQISVIGSIALLASSLTSVILFGGALLTIAAEGWAWRQPAPFQAEVFMYTLLLLFWSVVGWEVIGNYSGELGNPRRNLPRAIAASAAVIALVSLSIALAMRIVAGRADEGLTVTAIVAALFGPQADAVMVLLALSLCGCTFLLFVGGSARLMAAMAERRELPVLLAARTDNGAPHAAIALLTAVHLGLFAAVSMGFANVEQLVAVANGFFLCNGLIGIISAIKLLREPLFRLAAASLCVVMGAILLHGPWQVLLAITAMAVVVFARASRK